MLEPSAASVRRATEYLVRRFAPPLVVELVLERALARLGDDEEARRVGAAVQRILAGGEA